MIGDVSMSDKETKPKVKTTFSSGTVKKKPINVAHLTGRPQNNQTSNNGGENNS